ncbi:DUF2256 domain-containing protein [Cognatishimia activa]
MPCQLTVRASLRHWKTMKKSELPQKACPVCKRPFLWRKKWKKDWENVRYCSERCRRQRSSHIGDDE